MALLELRTICKSYRKGGLLGRRDRFEVLRDVDLTLERGRCLGLLGRSGVGKSTLGRIALGLEPPDSGEVRFRGRPLHSLRGSERQEARRNLQVVFQNSMGSVNPRWTAGQIVSEPIGNFYNPSRPALRDKVAELLEKTGLKADDAGKYPHQFSGGELQRVCIARAIAVDPAVIVLDEAVSSLDMITRARILDLLARLRREMGTAFLFISHDLRVLLKMADTLAVMHNGRIVDVTGLDSGRRHSDHPAFKELADALLPPVPAAG